MSLMLMDSSGIIGGDPTDPLLSTPPSGPLAVVRPGALTVGDFQRSEGAPVPAGINTNGILRVSGVGGGETGGGNSPLIHRDSISGRPAAFTGENWSASPTPLNRLQGRVGYQDAAGQSRTRIAAQDSITLATTTETTAAMTNPVLSAAVQITRRNRWGA